MARPKKVNQEDATPKKKVRGFNTAPVIVKCTGDGCLKKESCIRFFSEPAEKYQPWFTEEVSIPDKKKCGFYTETLEQLGEPQND